MTFTIDGCAATVERTAARSPLPAARRKSAIAASSSRGSSSATDSSLSTCALSERQLAKPYSRASSSCACARRIAGDLVRSRASFCFADLRSQSRLGRGGRAWAMTHLPFHAPGVRETGRKEASCIQRQAGSTLLADRRSPGRPGPTLLVERAPVEDDLARLPGPHGLEAALEFLDREVMCDHGRDVEAGLQQRRQLVPGLLHRAAVDAAHVEALEDHLVPVDGRVAGRDA